MQSIRTRLVTLSVTLGLLVAASQTQAGVLVDQSLPGTDNAYFADITFPQVVADNFTLASAGSPNAITFWGSYAFGNTPLSPDLFSVAFYADSAGLPGALISSVAISPSRSDYGPSDFGLEIYEYTASFSPVNLAAGSYWVSVVNDASADPSNQWAWSITANTYDDYFAYSGEASRTPTTWNPNTGGRDLAFILSEVTAVPEPSTLAAASLGGLALLALRRQRRRA